MSGGEEKTPELGPKMAIYVHLYDNPEKGIIKTFKMQVIAKHVRVMDLKAEMKKSFEKLAKGVKYIPESISKTIYAPPLYDTSKIRMFFEDGDDLYLKVHTEAVPIETKVDPEEKKDLVLSYKTLNNYSFYVASESVVRVMVPVPGIEKVPKENVIATFTEDSLEVKINNAENGNNYRFAVPKLDAKIIPEKSEAFPKGDKVIIRLKKANNSDHWSYLFKQKYVGE